LEQAAQFGSTTDLKTFVALPLRLCEEAGASVRRLEERNEADRVAGLIGQAFAKPHPVSFYGIGNANFVYHPFDLLDSRADRALVPYFSLIN
jgi:hypothetical protein